jgi:hypothetical protein
LPIWVLLIGRTSLSHFVLKFAPPSLTLTRRSSAALAFPRRKFATEAAVSTTQIVAKETSTAAASGGSAFWNSVNSALVGNAVGVTLAVTGIGAVAAATFAGITSYNLDKQFAQQNAKFEKHLKDQETKIETKVEKFVQAEKEVLKAQADSVKAQGDSVKGQAWAAYLIPTLASFAALYGVYMVPKK